MRDEYSVVKGAARTSKLPNMKCAQQLQVKLIALAMIEYTNMFKGL